MPVYLNELHTSGLCDGGHYRNHTAGECLPCPKGSYNAANRLSSCTFCPSGTTVDPGEGTQLGDCISVGEFKAFSMLTGNLVEVEERLRSLKIEFQLVIGEKTNKEKSVEGEKVTTSSFCEAGQYSSGSNQCNSCPEGKTVAAGEGKEIGDCMFIGVFKAFESLNEKVAGIEGKVSALERLVSKGESLKKTWRKQMKKEKSKNSKNKKSKKD